MGMYTEIFVNTRLKHDTPREVIEVIQAVCCGDYEFFENDPKRKYWYCLFWNCSFYFNDTKCAILKRWSSDDANDVEWSLLGKGDVRSKEDILAFFEFIKPWCSPDETDFIGYYRYESDYAPTLVYSGQELV